MERNRLVVKSGMVNLASQIICILLSFINRKIFIEFIGVDYLGLDSVISGVLETLSLAELGFKTSIVYRLYEPLASGDYARVNRIVKLLKYVYVSVGAIVAVVGLALVPALRFIIKGVDIGWDTIYISYLLMLASTVMTYFLAYRRTLMYANQMEYVTVIIDTWIVIAFSALRIVGIAVWHNYYLYVILVVVQNLVANLWVHVYCGRRYEWLDTKHSTIDVDTKKAMFSDTKNVIVGKLASYVYSATDNIVISAAINTVLVGYLGNYKGITGSVGNIVRSFVSPMQPIVGNYLAKESREGAYELFWNYTFVRYTISTVLLIPTWMVIDIFIENWYGKDYVLSWVIMALIVADLYIDTIYKPVLEYINALGYFKEIRRPYIVEAVSNMVISIVGALTVGLPGVLLGTVVSRIFMWIGSGRIVFGRYFEEFSGAGRKYMLNQLWYAVVFVGLYLVNYVVVGMIPLCSWTGFLVKGCVSVVICVAGYLLVFSRRSEFKYLLGTGRRILHR